MYCYVLNLLLYCYVLHLHLQEVLNVNMLVKLVVIIDLRPPRLCVFVQCQPTCGWSVGHDSHDSHDSHGTSRISRLGVNCTVDLCRFGVPWIMIGHIKARYK